MRKAAERLAIISALLIIPALSGQISCAAGNEGSSSEGTASGSGGSGGSGGGDGGLGFGGMQLDSGACENLQCQQVSCPGGGTTAVTGTVVAPTPPQFGSPDPIYNVLVYVPNAPVEPFEPGVTCTNCGTPVSGSPLVDTLTDAAGQFTLEDMPAGTNIPLVIQIGRWRRQVVIPEVPECTTTALPTELTRFPRTKQEGDIPHIAIASAMYDPEECILRQIGIADSEFTGSLGDGRVHIYQGEGTTIANTESTSALWGSLERLLQYDIVLLPCLSEPYDSPSGPEFLAARQNMFDYANAGGRVFATDLSYHWITDGPAPFPSIGQFVGWGGTGVNPLPTLVDQSFPKGAALAQWLQNIGATTTLGHIDLYETYSLFDAVNPPTSRWLYSTSPPTIQTLSFNTPVGVEAEQQCGRVVYSNFHIASGSMPGYFPSSCSSGSMTAQERVLEFLLFDLASCVQDETEEPTPPPK